MSAYEIFVAIGGTALVIFFLVQAIQRNREPDGYKHRDGLIEMARSQGKPKPRVALRPAAAKLLAERDRVAPEHRPRQSKHGVEGSVSES